MDTITDYLSIACRKNCTWTPEQVQQCLGTIRSRIAHSAIDWDVEAGEKWGRIIVGHTMVAIVSSLHPLALVVTEHAASVGKIPDLDIFPVDDMERCSYSAERGALESFFEGKLTHVLNLDSFSIEELWWATVTM